MLENNIKCKGVKLITSGGEIPHPHLAEKLQEVFGCPPTDIYGGTDVGMVGYQCPYCNLKFFDNDCYIIEILDNNYEPVKAGEKGNAVITVLDQFSTPFIRFDIGDCITIPSYEVLCKNKFDHYVSVDGRETDRLILEDGRVIHGQHLYDPLFAIEGIKKIQLIQKNNGEIRIKYVRKGGFDSKKIEKKILKYLKLYNNPKVSFEICDSIPLEPSGKFKIIKKETINSI